MMSPPITAAMAAVTAIPLLRRVARPAATALDEGFTDAIESSGAGPGCGTPVTSRQNASMLNVVPPGVGTMTGKRDTPVAPSMAHHGQDKRPRKCQCEALTLHS